MLGKSTFEISVKDMNWERANRLVSDLVEEGYAVLTTLEEELIIINAVYASYEYGQANRNEVAFMSRDEYYNENSREEDGE